MRVNGVIAIYGRPEYTYITLESLSRSNIADDLRLVMLYEATEELNKEAIHALALKYPFIITVVETIGNTASGMVRCGFEILTGYDADYYVYIENDILFNPNWLEKCVDILEHAKKKHKIGFISPINGSVTNRGYEDTYRIKKALPTGTIIFDREALDKAMEMPKEDWLSKPILADCRIGKYLANAGYLSITPHESLARHIGLKSISVGVKIKEHTRHFTPDEKIKDLYDIAEAYNA